MSKNKKVVRLPKEAYDQLEECIESLIIDAREYDNGNFKMIKRASTTIRILFHDTNMSKSLINQIDKKKNINMKSLIQYPIKEVLFYGNHITNARFEKPELISSGYYDTFLFRPVNKITYKLSFEDWWNGTIFLMNDYNLTRKKLITIVANQDGGAHFDPKIDNNYNHLINGNTGFSLQPGDFNHLFLGGSSKFNSQPVKFKDLHLALLREVVHETIISLMDRYNLKTIYSPDFDSNWNRRLNTIGFRLTLVKD